MIPLIYKKDRWYFFLYQKLRYRNKKEAGLLGTGAQITVIICITVLVALKMMLNSIDRDKKG